ncbi:MAG: 30S ribosome-binding factor RbfA [Nitrospiraceae bacterium]|nr:30S ribosome-binding factor RbfA [Nitrospiraceae bacterium]
MLPYKRSKRVADLLREELADIIMRRVKDPRLGEKFVTVVDVSVTDDLKLARVYVSTLKKEDREDIVDILKSARAFMRSELAKRLRMKSIPDLEFFIDTSIEYGSRIEKLLKDIKATEKAGD